MDIKALTDANPLKHPPRFILKFKRTTRKQLKDRGHTLTSFIGREFDPSIVYSCRCTKCGQCFYIRCELDGDRKIVSGDICGHPYNKRCEEE